MIYLHTCIRIIDEISAECYDVGSAFSSERSKVFYWLLGKPIPGVGMAQMNMMRVTAGTSINKIYRKVLMTSTGVG